MSSAARKWDEYDEENRPLDCHEHEPVRCTLADLAEVKGEPPTETFVADCDEYFGRFAKPIFRDGERREFLCFHCGQPLTGVRAFLLSRGGGFTWGLTHGEGHCGNCRWPARAYHFAKNAKGEDLFTQRGLVLQYLPEFVGKKPER